MKWSDLEVQYYTGRPYTISGSGRNRVTGYRNGIMCNLGDLEASAWCELVRKKIADENEQVLYQWLLEFMTDRILSVRTQKQLERVVLGLFASRIFDDEKWVLYVAFNQKYRPQIISPDRIAVILPSCCNKPGVVPKAQIEETESNEKLVCCPHCGAWTTYECLNIKMEDINNE